MVTSALNFMNQIEGRIEKATSQKGLARQASARREVDLKREASRITQELAQTNSHLIETLQRVTDLSRARPLFSD